MNNILMLIRTTSLIYDDRVRKEAVTISNNFQDYNLHICAFENNSSDYDIERTTIHRAPIKLRFFFPSNKMVFLKILEMYYRYFSVLRKNRYDVYWLHNFESFGIIPLLSIYKKITRKPNVKIVWDQHELPPSFFYSSRIGKFIYRKVISLCDKNIMASKDRIMFLDSVGALPKNHLVTSLDNLPDTYFISQEPEAVPTEVDAWLNGRNFFLCQGGYSKQRAFLEVVDAAIKSDVKILFVGPIRENLILEAMNRHGEEDVLSHCKFLDSVPQIRLIDYIDKALASLVFYKKDSVNNWHCAPNRFYQSLSRGTPVITGNNPLFASTLEGSASGLVCDTDGCDSDAIAKSLTNFIRNPGAYVVDKSFDWDSQLPKFSNILK